MWNQNWDLPGEYFRCPFDEPFLLHQFDVGEKKERKFDGIILRFRINKKIPRGPPSPPAPVMHSPSRKVQSAEMFKTFRFSELWCFFRNPKRGCLNCSEVMFYRVSPVCCRWQSRSSRSGRFLHASPTGKTLRYFSDRIYSNALLFLYP